MSPVIAVVQFRIALGEREKNLRRMERFVARAVRRGANVVVFPEDCVTGSIFGDRSKLDVTGANREAFRAMARRHGVDIVAGSSMEGTPDGNFNVSYYVDARGEVLGTYRKNHLYPSERAFLAPGTDVPVFETAHGMAAIVICWDMLFPEIFERMRVRGVQIIYGPSYWYREIADRVPGRDPKSEERLLDALCLARAVEANAALVYCNAAGVMRNPNGTVDTLIGHSQIVLPGLGTLRRFAHRREGMFLQRLDLSSLPSSENIYHG